MNSVQRIISLVPSTTEILYFLGLEEKIIGVTEHCDFPEEVRGKDKIGTFGQPELSQIISLNPDIVLANEEIHKEIIEKLQNNKIKFFAFSPSTVKDVFQMMNKIGLVCGAKDIELLINSLEERVIRLNQTSNSKELRVFRLMNTDPYVTPGPDSVQYDALKQAGAKLIDFDSQDSYITVSLNQIKEFDPEVILFCGAEKEDALPSKCKGCTAENPICRRRVDDIITPEWQSITAVQEGRVYPISCDTICRPGPRLIDGMEKLNRYFYAK